MSGSDCLKSIVANIIGGKNVRNEPAKVLKNIASAIVNMYILPNCIVVNRLVLDAKACVMGVMKYPANHADTSRDFQIFGAANTRMATMSARFLSPNSTIPEKKQRIPSKKNVSRATFSLENLPNMRPTMPKANDLQALTGAKKIFTESHLSFKIFRRMLPITTNDTQKKRCIVPRHPRIQWTKFRGRSAADPR
jgi:hypothetical protein